jgi:hypothetical protein
MLAAVSAGQIDAILCDRDDRLFREDRERMRFQDVLLAARVTRVFTASGGDFDLTTADGGRAFRDKGSAAQYYSDLLGERLREMHAEKVANGEWSGGARPFGYDIAGKSLVINEAEAAQIRDGVAAMLNGATIKSILREWNASGLPPVRGGRWGDASFRVLILSDRITGRRQGQKAQWAPIISVATQRALKDVYLARQGQAQRRTERYLLTGILRCGICTGSLVGRPSKGRRFYVCHATGPTHLGVSAKPLEDLVIQEARDREPEWQLAAVQDPREADPELMASLDALEAERHEWLTSGMRPADIAVGIRRIDAQREALEEQLAPPKGGLGSFADYLATLAADPEDMRPWLEAVIDHVLIRPARVHGRPYLDADRVSITWR